MTRLHLAAACLVILLNSLVTAHAVTDDYQDARRLFTQGNYGPALDRIDAILAKQPKDARARFLKGLILTEQGKPDEAINVFTALTQDFPELPEPYNNLAVLYAAKGQDDKARKALEMAIRTHPSYATAHENLGDLYAKMAREAYDKALQLDSTNTSAKTKLALVKELFSAKAGAQALVKGGVAEPTPTGPKLPARGRSTGGGIRATGQTGRPGRRLPGSSVVRGQTCRDAIHPGRQGQRSSRRGVEGR
jgi:Flp pilus assembly protein TadD